MAFFKLFPTQQYDFNRDGVLQNVIDIYRSVRPEGYKVDNTTVYKLETVQNGERPDRMSERLYGTTDYYWTFFVINEFLNLGCYPRFTQCFTMYPFCCKWKTFIIYCRNLTKVIIVPSV